MIFRHGGNFNLIGKTEYGVNLVKQTNDIFDFVLHLIPGHKDMGVVLGEAANAEKTVKRTGKLVTVNQTKLRHAKRQVAVRVRLKLVNKHTAGAVHGLDGKVGVVNNGGVHILFIVIPVTGTLPKGAVENHRSGNFNIAVSLVNFAPIFKQGVAKNHTFGKEEGEAGALVKKGKQPKLFAKLAVVAFFGFFNAGQVCLKLVFFGVGNAVNALKGFVLCVAAPICAVALGKLKCFYSAGGHKMRACAKVNKFALAIEGNNFALGKILDKLDLVRLVSFFHKGDGFLSRKGEALDFFVLFDDFFHFRFKLFKNIGSEGLVGIKIVIESFFNSGAYGKLDFRIKALYRLGKNVRGGVPESLFAIGVVKGKDFYRAVIFNGCAKVAALSVDFCGAGDSCKAGADAFGNLVGGDSAFVFADIIAKLDFYHVNLYLLYNCKYILHFIT